MKIDVLSVKFRDPDWVGAETIGEFFRKSMIALLLEDEDFSGKRPLGNSDWFHAICDALVLAGLIRGTYDESIDELTDCDTLTAVELIKTALKNLKI